MTTTTRAAKQEKWLQKFIEQYSCGNWSIQRKSQSHDKLEGKDD